MADDRTAPQYKLRLTPEIKQAIEDAAKTNNRSMNAEIISRLEWSFEAGVVEEAGTDISRAMTWADHSKTMNLVMEATSKAMRELHSELARVQKKVYALSRASEEAKMLARSEDPEGAN